MFAADVMSAPVLTVERNSTVGEIARLMSQHRIGGLPVIDASGDVVGMVTDGDLCRRADLGTERKPQGLVELLFVNRPDEKDFVKSRGRTAEDVMTREVYAVRPDTPLSRIADIFERRGIRRAPVIDGGRLVGIVSRADLVRSLAAMPEKEASVNLPDRHVRDLALEEFWRLNFGLRSQDSVIVKDGVVHLWGLTSSETEKRALRLAIEGVPGVKGVKDHTRSFLQPFAVEPKSSSRLIFPD